MAGESEKWQVADDDGDGGAPPHGRLNRAAHTDEEEEKHTHRTNATSKMVASG